MTDDIKIFSAYSHPDEVLSDQTMSATAKRTLLASWLSDARTVESMPALRMLDSGALVHVDVILRCLKTLDERAPASSAVFETGAKTTRRRRPRWPRVSWRGHDSDDGGPPPSPAYAAMKRCLSQTKLQGA